MLLRTGPLSGVWTGGDSRSRSEGVGLSDRLGRENAVEDRRTRVPTRLHLDLSFGVGEGEEEVGGGEEVLSGVVDIVMRDRYG